MKTVLEICLALVLMVSLKLSFSQEFSSSEKLSDNLNKVEVVFKEIKSVESKFQIISTLKEIDGVSDVEFFTLTEELDICCFHQKSQLEQLWRNLHQ